MDDTRAADLLVQIAQGDRGAFRDLYDEGGPDIAAHLASVGVPPAEAADAIVACFSDIWRGDYTPPPLPEQGDSSANMWLRRTTMDYISAPSQGAQPPMELNDALWARVTTEAFPESLRNIIRRMDVLFAVIAAAVWAVLLLILTS